MVSIIHGGSIRGQLPFGIHRRACRLAVRHASTFEDVLGVPILGEVEACSCALDVDAEEEVEGAHVADSEFCLKKLDDVLEKSLTGSSENYVIDVE